ncbi:MAG: LD-carboxypeptidase [Actinomycetota bacterium]|nr:LD-carboxypeptidase [Actinomycetota bacterium]
MVAPSGGAAARYPSRLDRGVAALRDLGFEPVVMPHACHDAGLVSSPVEDRLADLHAAYADDTVAGIVTTVGGHGAAQLLAGLDYDLIASNPKVFCGYSDTTALHAAIGRHCRAVSFYGPSVMADFADWPAPHPGTTAWWSKAVSGPDPLGSVPGWDQIATGTTDWAIAESRRFTTAPPPRVLRPGRGEGPLAGGCLPVLCELLGTPWGPELRGTIAVVETPGDTYGVGQALSDLTHLRNAGMLDSLAGLVIGWPGDLGHLPELAAIAAEATRGTAYPVLLGAAVGHSQPKLTIPLGCRARLDGDHLTVLEAGVAVP